MVDSRNKGVVFDLWNTLAYESLARRLTSNTETLLQLKKKIENNKTTQPLFCAKTYMSHFEGGLEEAFKMWRNNQDFDHITI